MKKTFGIIALAALVMLAGCKKNEQPTGTTKLTAGIEQHKSDSKTSLDGLQINWTAGDQLYVYDKDGEAPAYFNLISGAGTPTGVFEGNYNFTDENVAVYPISCMYMVDNKSLQINLPATQTASGSSSFGNGANPMLGVFSDINDFTLTSLCGVLCLQLRGDNVGITAIEIVGGAEDKLCGRFKINDYTNPALTYLSNGSNKVTLNFTETVTLTDAPQNFYVVLPPVHLTGLTMNVYNNADVIFTQSTTTSFTAFDITANHVETMYELDVVPTPAATVPVESITLNKTETTLTVGETETLSVASVQPTNATDPTVTWSSDDTSVATVDATTGEVTAVAAGTATITATANDGSNVTATCAVTVNAPAPTVPEGIVNGLYSVSATKQVWFSKGNLQYQVLTGNWRFAEHQWDYCQTSNGAWNYSNWIDYFTWGTWTGSNPNPLETSNIDESIYTFAATDFDQTLHGSDAWRTLTIEEWYCLFYERASGATVTTTSGTTNNARFAKATINTNVASVNGLILFPDGVTIASNEATTWGTINDIENEWGTKCTSAQWTDLENKGCVFLPAAGDHHGDGNSPVTAFAVGAWGFYWSSSNMSAQAGYCVYFSKDDMRPIPTNTYYNSWHSTGMCVRLVQDYN